MRGRSREPASRITRSRRSSRFSSMKITKTMTMPAVASGLTSGPTIVVMICIGVSGGSLDLDRHRRLLLAGGATCRLRRRGAAASSAPARSCGRDRAPSPTARSKSRPPGGDFAQRVDLGLDVVAVGRQAAAARSATCQATIQPKARMTRKASVTTVSTAGRFGTGRAAQPAHRRREREAQQHGERQRHEDVAAEVERRRRR